MDVTACDFSTTSKYRRYHVQIQMWVNPAAAETGTFDFKRATSGSHAGTAFSEFTSWNFDRSQATLDYYTGSSMTNATVIPSDDCQQMIDVYLYPVVTTDTTLRAPVTFTMEWGKAGVGAGHLIGTGWWLPNNSQTMTHLRFNNSSGWIRATWIITGERVDP